MHTQEVEVVREQLVHVPKIIEQKRVQQRTVEQVVEIPVPQVLTEIMGGSGRQVVEEVVHVPKVMTQVRQNRIPVEQTVEIPVPMTEEEVVEVPEIITQVRVQHQQVEQTIEVPVPMREEEPLRSCKPLSSKLMWALAGGNALGF